MFKRTNFLPCQCRREVAGAAGSIDAAFHGENAAGRGESPGPLLFAAAGDLSPEVDEQSLPAAINRSCIRKSGVKEHTGYRAIAPLIGNLESAR